MPQSDRSPSPGEDQAGRRGLFSGRGRAAPDAVTADDAALIQQLMGAYQATIQRQLEEGLTEIRRTANSLMHEIASEVWRAAGGDKDEVRSKILQELSRDQAIRSLIAHSDDRFQTLSIRTARVEETLNVVATSLRDARDRLASSIEDIPPGSAEDAAALRAQLTEVTKQVGEALATLADRDQAIVDTVRARVREHGELITQETTRIAQAMEGYVQHGVEAIGQLAGAMEAQVQSFGTREEEIAGRVGQAVEQQMTLLGEQLQLMYERLAIDTTAITDYVTSFAERGDEHTRAVGEYLHVLHDRVDVVTRDAVAQLNHTLEERVMGLARLVRSDAEALRAEIATAGEARDEVVRSRIDEAITRLEAHGDERSRTIDEAITRLEAHGDERSRTIDEAITRLEAHGDERSRTIDGQMDQALTAMDRNMIRMTDVVESHLEHLEHTVADRAAHAVEVSLGERFDDVLARLHAATGSLEGHRGEMSRSVGESVDERMGSLARLIRSDNETLAQQIVADQEASKQALRAMKELQANLPAEVIEMVEQRFASLAESIERSNEFLTTRIDRMAEKLGERYDSDIKVVVDRMGDAMHALASLGRPDDAPQATRIELE
jgi:ABC-type transporter Mla subunit MlaD